MLSNVRRKIVQKDIKKYSELRIEDWWNVGIVSYIRKYSHSGNQRYSMKNTRASFEHPNIQTDLLIPYYKVGKTTYNLIPCPSGSFTKGYEHEDGNLPQEMKIEKSFLLGETEITQELYCAVMNVENPSDFKKKPKNPVECVSWYDALIFCNKLSDIFGLEHYYRIGDAQEIYNSKKERKEKHYPTQTNENSKGFRLPTEWEWEYAAKAGTQSLHSGSDDLNKVGWYKDNSDEKTHEVKGKIPNAWGFYDMSGNVWEWCENKYNPNNTDISATRVIRGGSWYSNASNLRSAYRGNYSPSNRDDSLGFRVCRYI